MRGFILLNVVSGLLALVLSASSACARAAPAAEEAVVATVGGEPIDRGDVERLLDRTVAGQEVNPAVLPVLQAQVLAEIVDRELVLAYARRTNSAPSEPQIDAALGELKARVTAQGKSLDQYLKERSMDEADLRRQVTWDLVWPKYAARYATEERLASYFAAHRREFDGTQISVSHVLLRPQAGTGPQAMDKLVEEARTLRDQITSGKLSFEEAARRHSAGPSARQGGKLGFINRRGPMVESFSRAAFALEPGQVSEPVVTRFGVHLIRCDEIKPGTGELNDVRDEVQEALARELLEKLARFEERHTPVEFTGKWPHFKPGTRELAVP
jgi:parvulin-like peptidyl-prolyl isomerase